MKKRVLALIMTCTMVFAMSGCGAKEDPAPKNEVVQETAEKVETQKEETKEEVKEEAKAEDSTDAAPFHPTSRTQYRSLNGATPIEIPETIEYAADGSYTVTGTYLDKNNDTSYDYVYRYNQKAELEDFIIRAYSAYAPDGIEQEVKLVSGYPISVTQDAKDYATDVFRVESFTSDFTANGGISVQNGKITSNLMKNHALNELGKLLPEFYTSSDKGERYSTNITPIAANDFGLPMETELESIVEYRDNALIISYVFRGEGYNLETRNNETMTVYDSVEISKYNQQGLLESIETYRHFKDKAASIDVNDLSGFDPNGYAYYTYDSNGNLTEIRARAEGSYDMHITYSYGDSASASESSSAPVSNDVTGGWKLRDKGYTYDRIYLNADGTGTLYKGMDAYNVKYTFDGKKVNLHADLITTSKDFVFYVNFDDGVMVEGESDAPYIRE